MFQVSEQEIGMIRKVVYSLLSFSALVAAGCAPGIIEISPDASVSQQTTDASLPDAAGGDYMQPYEDLPPSQAENDADSGADGDRDAYAGENDGAYAGEESPADAGVTDIGCSNQCSEGGRRCQGAGYDLCRDSDGDGCRDWGTHFDCPQGQYCRQEDASCQAQPTQFEVEWLDFDELNGYSDPGWGEVLTDIVRHCPPEWVSTYYDSDRVTHGHETTHGINSYIRNYLNHTGQRVNGFYVLENRAVIMVEPSIRKHQAAEFVPAQLRADRFEMYITGQSAWDDTPLYIFDEWTAYSNGTAVAVDLYLAGAWHWGWRDACMGTIEFVVYSTALAMAVERYDPSYFSGYRQFTAFLGWQLEHALALYRQCATLEPFQWERQEAYFNELRSEAGRPLRQFLERIFGLDSVARWLD